MTNYPDNPQRTRFVRDPPPELHEQAYAEDLALNQLRRKTVERNHLADIFLAIVAGLVAGLAVVGFLFYLGVGR